MTDRSFPDRVPDRVARRTLTGLAAAGLGVPLVASCSGDDASDDAAATDGDAGGVTLGPPSEVPVGGGKIYDDAAIVATQPTEGEFRAFTTTCTHRGCAVSSVANGIIECICHGSQYDIADGSVLRGPAQDPLVSFPVSVVDGQLTTG